MRSTPVFGDPETDFVFQRIFGSEDHQTALLGFLNDILQLDETHRIASVTLLPPEQRPQVKELKSSIVDVKCVDAAGTTYVVERQVFNVEEFEKRLVYDVANAYTNLRREDGRRRAHLIPPEQLAAATPKLAAPPLRERFPQ